MPFYKELIIKHTEKHTALCPLVCHSVHFHHLKTIILWMVWTVLWTVMWLDMKRQGKCQSEVFGGRWSLLFKNDSWPGSQGTSGMTMRPNSCLAWACCSFPNLGTVVGGGKGPLALGLIDFKTRPLLPKNHWSELDFNNWWANSAKAEEHVVSSRFLGFKEELAKPPLIRETRESSVSVVQTWEQ